MAEPKTIALRDYRPTDYIVEALHLHFDLQPEKTVVKSIIDLAANPEVSDFKPAVVFDGEELDLISVAIDGKVLDDSAYSTTSEHLIIENTPQQFRLEIEVAINPAANKALSGLYVSGGNFCTQCEAQGFRRITYFYDRPDVMTKFTTCISADRDLYPNLLSNGNLIDKKDLDDNRHWVKWEDPSLKSCYLFALVAGDFDLLEDSFKTLSGRDVALHLYLEKGFVDQGAYALEALKRSMRWDEETFGREYDLDLFMIVAVSDFNMGAMENKGLNVFNTKYILAKPETATDQDYTAIESVIGHEYFHNWSGNRVTCRDWFQITLKEGLTIYRDQNFTADMTSPGVTRINNVNVLRNVQFPQDAGPMAHPIRPEEYIEVNNFYTVTVYNKGSEVIRMLESFLGWETFRAGMDLYFSRYDGKAVTTEDFVAAMSEVSGRDFTQFLNWYRQAGTPELTVSTEFDAQHAVYNLHVKQHCQDTVGQCEKLPFELPLAVGFLDAAGNELELEYDGVSSPTHVLTISNPEHVFSFKNCNAEPVPSLLRNFSAPVKLHYNYSQNQLRTLLLNDTDAFCRWEAGQRYYTEILLKLINDVQSGRELECPQDICDLFAALLASHEPDAQLLALLLILPSESTLNQRLQVVDPGAVYAARKFLHSALAEKLYSSWLQLYNDNYKQVDYKYEAHEIGRRALQNIALAYLCASSNADAYALASAQYKGANNMTDTMGALQALNNTNSAERAECLAAFYNCWQDQPLVVDKWLMLEASTKNPGTLERVQDLLDHPAFSIDNPNKVRSLIGAFAANSIYFHAQDGSGYEFLADQLSVIDEINPQLSARLAEPFTRLKRYDTDRQERQKMQIHKLLAGTISNDLYEIIQRTLDHVADS
jgi:aminopeptidase N